MQVVPTLLSTARYARQFFYCPVAALRLVSPPPSAAEAEEPASCPGQLARRRSGKLWSYDRCPNLNPSPSTATVPTTTR
jgi:hypothetical protein